MNGRSLTMALAMGQTLLLAAAAGTACGQAAPPPDSSAVAVASGHPQRDTLTKMMRAVTIEFKDTRLEDALKFVQDVTGADIEAMWQDDRHTTGLDKEMQISLKADRVTALALLEKVLEKASTDSTGAGGNSWQLTESGTLQIGPKERLNKYKRVELYAINDLLLVLPSYTNAPEFDLNAVLQNTGQGGSSQSPFRDAQNQPPPQRPIEERAQDIINLITSLVEQEQWVENGGEGASIRFFQGSLIVNGPDYIHRQINGYPYWPARTPRLAMGNNGRRYVTMGVDTANSQLIGITNTPVTAVVGGRLISSDPNQGPGGQAQPDDKDKNQNKDKKPPDKKK